MYMYVVSGVHFFTQEERKGQTQSEKLQADKAGKTTLESTSSVTENLINGHSWFVVTLHCLPGGNFSHARAPFWCVVTIWQSAIQ